MVSNRTKNEITPAEGKLLLTSNDNVTDNLYFGLMITLNPEDGTCRLSFCEDENYHDIHPNIYAPSSLKQVVQLGGGGSGVTIFSGNHLELGDIVMKHGGYKDMRESFALVTIARQLKLRTTVQEAADDMQRRIPEFKMIYISPRHLREKGKDLWCKLKTIFYGLERGMDEEYFKRNLISVFRGETISPSTSDESINEHCRRGRCIRLFSSESDKFSLDIDLNKLDFYLGQDATVDKENSCIDLGHPGEGALLLKALVDELIPTQKERMWKFTFAQKRIGGASPRTASSLLTDGLLHGALLDNLINQFIQVVHNLESLTLPEEKDVLHNLQKEIGLFEEQHFAPEELSKEADAFLGNAIRKNWRPETGRFARLRKLGKQFRTPGSIFIAEEEVLPCQHLGTLMIAGSNMGDVFVDAPMEPTIIFLHRHSWRNVMKHAVSGVKSEAAKNRIWNCGLADAGLHNLFLSHDKLWLFDLGEPCLQSLPGFLTKFLFSFFHTLGMEEDGKGSWVKRFERAGDKLGPTKETTNLLPKAYDAFEEVLDTFIEKLFDGDDSVRWLCLQYVTLQLLSDASFCLERWEVKGGGRPRNKNHQKGIEKWLWRALWDLYAAFDISKRESMYRLKVFHPSQC